MDFQTILKNIQQKKFDPIYFLHGEEAFYIDKITEALSKNVLDDSEKEFNQTVLYGKEAEILSLISEAKSFPFVGERKLVILKEAKDFKKINELEAYFSAPNPSTIFVVEYKYKRFDSRKKVFKTAQKNGLVFHSEKVRDYKIVDWITRYVKEQGHSITPKAAMLLGEFLGTDLNKIANELEKLNILIEKGTTINDVHIEENIGISKDYNVFELQNAISVRDVPKAFKIVHYFEHNPKAASILQVIPTIFKFYTQLMTIHFLPNKSRDAVAKALRLPPFIAGQLIAATKVFNPKKIAANINILHEYDLKAKGVNRQSTTEGELLKEMVYKLLN